MSLEIRKVPPHWEHPRNEKGQYKPLRNETYREAITEWVRNHLLWIEGKHPNQDSSYCFWAEYEGDAPQIETYMPDSKERTWLQVYENVSEGTPVTPPFATKQELIDHLCTHGTAWDVIFRKFEKKGWKREEAERFLECY